jgi:hypothetical protein
MISGARNGSKVTAIKMRVTLITLSVKRGSRYLVSRKPPSRRRKIPPATIPPWIAGSPPGARMRRVKRSAEEGPSRRG